MREISSYNMLPLPCDSLNEHMFNCGSTSLISSNGYYGYQPPIQNSRLNNTNHHENERPVTNERVQMDLEFNNAMDSDTQMESSINLTLNRHHKKRRWEHVEHQEVPEGFKKRRESNEPPFAPKQEIHFRKPTHNMPDQRRCFMEDVIKDLKKNIAKEDQDKLLEDILRETHGVSMYHWLGN